MGKFDYILGADNSSGKDYAREITIEKGDVNVDDLPIARQKKQEYGSGLYFSPSVRYVCQKGNRNHYFQLNLFGFLWVGKEVLDELSI